MKKNVLLLIIVTMLAACQPAQKANETQTPKIKILIDTDANNELDDQHALLMLS